MLKISIFDFVTIKKGIISIILLLTYSLGFAHNFIPHAHNTENETHPHSHQNDEHSDHHHNVTKSLNGDHKHIPHGDHYDKGLYDLIICFLHDANPHQDESKHDFYFPLKTNNKLSSKWQKFQLIATLFLLITAAEQTDITDYFNVN